MDAVIPSNEALTGDTPHDTPNAPETTGSTPVAGPLPGGGGQERDDATGEGLQPPRSRAARHREQAALDREAESDAIDSLIATAREGGFEGDEAALSAELVDRLELFKELDRDAAESGLNPQVLLRAIAKAGGLSIKAETGMKGEIEWLKEFQDTQPSKAKRQPGNLVPLPYISGQVAGVRGVFRNDGLPLDGIVEYLGQDPQFAHIQSIDDVIEAIREAATAERRPEALTNRFMKSFGGARWWDRVGTAPVDEGVSPEPSEPAAQKPRYAMLLRPASSSTLPRGLGWDFVEAPAEIAARRGLPVAQEYPFGVIETDRALTDEEVEHFLEAPLRK